MVTNRRWFIPYLVGFMASGTPVTGSQGWCLAFFEGFCRSGAHTLARSIWARVVSGQPYDEAKAFDTIPPPPPAESKTSTTKPAP